MISFPLDIDEPEITAGALENLHDLAVGSPTGGMYPVGANGLWHGGLHLSLGEEPPVYACAPGHIVAARLDPDAKRATCAYGHTNFILTKHTWPPSASGEEGTPFFVLCMHLAPRPLEAVAQRGDVAPWLTGEPLLRVTADRGLNVRLYPKPDGTREGGVPRGGLVKPRGEPTDRGGYRWQEVQVLRQDLEGHLALGPLKNGTLQERWTEEAPPPGGSDLVGKLQGGTVANLEVPVEAGEMLWWGGRFGQDLSGWDEELLALVSEAMGYPEPTERAPTVHWEIFSPEKAFGLEEGGEATSNGETKSGSATGGKASNGEASNGKASNGEPEEDGALSMPSWTAKKDAGSVLTFDPEKSEALSLIKEKRQAAEDLPDEEDYSTLSLGEKKTIHLLEAGQELRTYAVKYASEWGLDTGGLKTALKESPAHDPEADTADFEAFQFWSKVKALPDSPKVWHYHPVTALRALATKHPWFYVEEPDGKHAVETMEEVHQAEGTAVHVSETSDTWLLGHEHEKQGLYNDAESSPNLYELLIDPADQEGVPRGELSDHERRVWASLSAIEGHLRAINTWDSAYLSAGPLQKTAGAQYRGTTAKGELFGAIGFLLNPSNYEEDAFLSKPERDIFRQAFQRHFGDRLSFAKGEIQFGVPKAHPEVNGTVWSSPAQKEQLRSELEWAYQFAKAYTDPNFREPMLRKGLGRLDTIMGQQLRFPVTVNGTEHTLQPELRDVFSRDLSQALLLGWHINWPNPVWEPENSEWFDTAPDLKEDSRKTYVTQRLQEWGVTSQDDLPLSRDQELRLVVLLLRARMDSPMSDPAGRAGKILRYAPDELIGEIVEMMDFTRRENESQMDFIQRGLETELYEVDEEGNVTSAWAGWHRGRHPEDPNQNAVLTDFDRQSNSE
jgi:hypothetical protein